MPCKVCCSAESKYKCSTCYIPYCSSICWKKHKSLDDCKPQKKTEPSDVPEVNVDQKYFTEDTVSMGKLRQLGESKKLCDILGNKYLRHTLLAVENAKNPEKALFEAMKDPDFVSFVDECLRIVEDDKDG